MRPEDLKTLEDLRRFPFTAKSDLRDAYPFGMFAIPREQCVRVHASSGTTGRPTVVGYSAKDIETWAEVMARLSEVDIDAAVRRAAASPGEALRPRPMATVEPARCASATPFSTASASAATIARSSSGRCRPGWFPVLGKRTDPNWQTVP